MKFLLATKQQMVQYFDESGRAYAATLLSAGPVVVTQVKNKEKDGYTALQVGFGSKKKITKPLRGHFSASGTNLGNFRFVKEFKYRGDETPSHSVGNAVDVSTFNIGDSVSVSGLSKGKGFQGVVKRYGFAGGRRTHGQKHSEREPGSIGATGPQEVFKGTRMAGRMGGNRVNVKNLKVLAIDKEKNEMLLSGAVPGRRGTLLEIRSTKT